MIRIVADDKIPFLKGALEPFSDIRYIPGTKISKEDLIDTDALLIRTRTKCTSDLLSGTKVKFIGTATIGFDHIDTQFCEKNKIAWTNAPGCNSSSVEQYITAVLLKIEHDHKFTLKGKTIGIVGVGNVGTKVARIAKILGMNVLLNDPPRSKREGNRKFVGLDIIVKKADIITVHVPLSFVGENKTYHLFKGKIFKMMKKGVWFINSSRGEVVKTSGLKKYLDIGKIRGAIVDVWENEPDIDLELMSKAFIATPHIAGYSTDGKANGTSIVVNSLCLVFKIPLKDWYPQNVPLPLVPALHITCKGKTDYDIIREAVFHSYNIEEDNLKLRLSPPDFEKQRGDYPLRREFPAYSIHLERGNRRVQGILQNLGFKIIKSQD